MAFFVPWVDHRLLLTPAEGPVEMLTKWYEVPFVELQYPTGQEAQ